MSALTSHTTLHLTTGSPYSVRMQLNGVLPKQSFNTGFEVTWLGLDDLLYAQGCKDLSSHPSVAKFFQNAVDGLGGLGIKYPSPLKPTGRRGTCKQG